MSEVPDWVDRDMVWDSALGCPSPDHMQPAHVRDWLAANDATFETILGREVRHYAADPDTDDRQLGGGP